MNVIVFILIILWFYIGGQKSVLVSGDILGVVISDLEVNYLGIFECLMDLFFLGKLYCFVNIYVNDEDVWFFGGLVIVIVDGDLVIIFFVVVGG